MCQAKPGRRCSHHTSVAVVKSKQVYGNAFQGLGDAQRRLQAAEGISSEFPSEANRSTVDILRGRVVEAEQKLVAADRGRTKALCSHYATDAGGKELANTAEAYVGVRTITKVPIQDINGVSRIVPLPVEKEREANVWLEQARDLKAWQDGASKRLTGAGLTVTEKMNQVGVLKAAVVHRIGVSETKKEYFSGLVSEYTSRWVEDPNDFSNVEALGRAHAGMVEAERAGIYSRIKRDDLDGFVKNQIFKPSVAR